MEAIKIDSRAHSVAAIEIRSDLGDFYRELGCSTIEAIPIGRKNLLIIDEEGLLKDNQDHIFCFADQVYVGNGIIVGNGGEDFVSTTMNLDLVKALTSFYKRQDFSPLEPSCGFIS